MKVKHMSYIANWTQHNKSVTKKKIKKDYMTNP